MESEMRIFFNFESLITQTRKKKPLVRESIIVFDLLKNLLKILRLINSNSRIKKI